MPCRTALKIKNAIPQGRAYKLADTAGLYLLVEPIGSKKWRFKFRFEGKESSTTTIWRIPAARMKAKRPHFVPLSKQALTVLRGMQLLNNGMKSEYAFPHRDRPNKPMEGASLNALLHRMGYRGLATPQGMRATFSTHFNALVANPDVIERCLAHDAPQSVRSAYNRHQYEDSDGNCSPA